MSTLEMDSAFPAGNIVVESIQGEDVYLHQGRRCPGFRDNWREHIFQVGAANPASWTEQRCLGEKIAVSLRGPLPYDPEKNLSFGTGWNTASNNKWGVGFMWRSAWLPGVPLMTTLKIPHVNASGAEEKAGSARLFGRDLAGGLCGYLREMENT